MNPAAIVEPAQLRMLVCAPPKSGSTYISNVCVHYFGVAGELKLDARHFMGDHDLSPVLARDLRGYRFSFNLHMLPHVMNVLMARQEQIWLTVVWRNLGDMFVSIDEHSFRELDNGPAFYATDASTYRALSREQRQLVRVDMMLPWYLRFYLMWRACDAVMHPYEQMLTEREAFFTRILEPMLGPVDPARLAACLDGAPGENRLNVGRAGRSASELSEAAKREMELRIMRHPDWEQLEILLWELPWPVPALASRHALDGEVVCAGEGGAAYFISRGRRYPVGRPSWLESRFGARRVPRPVASAELEALPLGATLY